MEEKLQRSSEELADSIAQLTMELDELKAEKKAKVAHYNERIKDLEESIRCEQQQWKKLKAREEAS